MHKSIPAILAATAILAAKPALSDEGPSVPVSKPAKIPAIPYKLTAGTPSFLVKSGGVERKASVSLRNVHFVPLAGGFVQMRKDGAVDLQVARIAQGNVVHRVTCFVDQTDGIVFRQFNQTNTPPVKVETVAPEGLFVHFDFVFPGSGTTFISLTDKDAQSIPAAAFGWGYCTVAKAPAAPG